MISSVKHFPASAPQTAPASSHPPVVVALAGNPNSGKTTLFNRLTGARQHVGNYPGVTVERKEGQCRHRDAQLKVVDLPGTYSLSAFSPEEKVARDFILKEHPGVVVDIIDATNLERNLYLAVQLLELGAPVVLAFNFCDATRQQGVKFDLPKLSQMLGAPVTQISGKQGDGVELLLDAARERAAHRQEWNPLVLNYGPIVEREIERLVSLMSFEAAPLGNLRWLAIKLLENDPDLLAQFAQGALGEAVRQSQAAIERDASEEAASLIAGARYALISEVCQATVQAPARSGPSWSDRIDAVATHRVWGLPLFLAVMYLTFQLTFAASEAPMGWIEGFFGWLGGQVGTWWPEGSESPLKSLLVDGVISGVGAVLVFLPNILWLFLAIAILEDSGYMARAAFIMDRVMHKFGLHGKSFIPMLIGFGCSVPAIMATRTLESRRDRLATMLVIPLISCGARLPIYALIIPAFFPSAWQAPMLWLLYVTGVVLAVLLAKLLRSTALKGEAVPFVMELPPYRIPTLRDIAIHMWERGWLYLKKAGTIILGISIVLWAMTHYPKKTVFERDYAAEAAQARQASLEKITQLKAAMGLPAADSQLLAAIQQLPAMAGLVDSSPTAAMAAGATNGPVARFLETQEKLAALRTEHASALEAASESGQAELKQTQAAEMAALEKADPATFAMAQRFLDDIQAPYAEKMETIGREENAEKLAYSVAGRIGHAMEPVLAPLGFDWRIGTALVGAFAAKEVFVAQMGIVYSLGEADETSATLREKLRATYTPLAAFCIMLFCLISTPCMATTAVVRKESGSWGWAIGQWVGLTMIAYFLTLFVYQIGKFTGFGH